jgi:ATP:ADP antiporter, AAA family
MGLLRKLRRQVFDIRHGEHLRTWSMFAYLLCVLFAYYILKPVSRALFLNKFDIDKLPSLYIVIAVFGGVLAYSYSKLASKTSLKNAVAWAMSLSVFCLVVMWWLIGLRLSWMIYVLNVWVSLFAIVLVAQGWLVASNLFNAQEAKRLYPLLGMGMVVGAAFGGAFTARAALVVGTHNLLLASAVMVILAYAFFRLAIRRSAKSLETVRAGHEEDAEFSFMDVSRDIARTRHLQVIIGIMVVTFIVDVLVEYQFQVMAKQAYSGDQLTAFFGQFYGIYLNAIEFVFQLFLTTAVVRAFGVGGALQIMPIAILGCSAATILKPGVTSAGAVRLTEAATRYTLNRTGMELLYLPLPLELRNRIKAFIDIFVDRFSRGLGGVLLVFLTVSPLHLGIKPIAILVAALAVPWILLSIVAKREYVATVRRRLESRRLEFDSARVTVTEAGTIRLLEDIARGPNPRKAAYALDLLGQANVDIRPLLGEIGSAAGPGEALDKVYDLARGIGWNGLADRALRELRNQSAGEPSKAGIRYVLAVTPDAEGLASELLKEQREPVMTTVLEFLRGRPAAARRLITREWLSTMASSGDPAGRAAAAVGIGASGDHEEMLHRLLDDPDPSVAAAACRSAGWLQDRQYVVQLIDALAHPALRREAIAALVSFGPGICGTLGDALLDMQLPARVRRQVARVLGNIPHQRSADVLLSALGTQDMASRGAVLKALNRLRETPGDLRFDDDFIEQQILAEARLYYELSAALAPFRERRENGRAVSLLARTVEDRLKNTLERLFRLLGLRYPPKEIYSAYVAVSRRDAESAVAALEFLDNVVDRNLKRFLLPLLDAPDHLLAHGRELFGVEPKTLEEAIRELIHFRDPWLAACAMASAAELNLRNMAADIAQAAEGSEEEVSEVARSVEATLAA